MFRDGSENEIQKKKNTVILFGLWNPSYRKEYYDVLSNADCDSSVPAPKLRYLCGYFLIKNSEENILNYSMYSIDLIK